MGAQSTQDSSAAGSALSSSEDNIIPNWRVLSLPKEGDADSQAEISRKLQQRAQWSHEQYQQALALHDKFIECSDSYIAPGIIDALNCLDHAYRLYGPHSVICSFNGGKDAVVILQLMRAAHAQHYRQLLEEQGKRPEDITMVRPRALYFEHEDEFPEVLSYLHRTVEEYDLDFIAFQKGIKFNQGLEVLVHNNIPPESKISFPMGFVLGTRVGDPNAGSQGYFAPSSHYMPPFMRVNPVLEWTYGQVWHFLRVFSLPYCVLYDQGYTSLGTTKDTFPCPALAVPGSKGCSLPKFWPAFMLQDWSQERAGRIKKEKKGKKHIKTIPEESTSVKEPSAAAPPTAAPPSVQESVVSIPTALMATDPQQMGNTPPAPTPGVVAEDRSSTNASLHGSSYTKDALDDSWSYASNHSLTQRTAGLLVIGDEILKGSTADTNTQVAAKSFRENSILLKRVVIVSDDQEAIVSEILSMQNEVDVIVTSGGVGPTHDDVTIKSVAAALNQDMVLHDEMAKLLQEKMGKTGDEPTAELTEAQRKMATLPSRSKLRYLNDPQDWPVLQVRNVFILPGVPEFFAQKIESVADYMSSDELERSAVYKVVLSVDEASIVSTLNSAVENFPDVTFGSYPFVSHPDYKTVLTLEGRLRSAEPEVSTRKSFSKPQMDHNVRLALDFLLTNLPSGSILRVENDDGLL